MVSCQVDSTEDLENKTTFFDLQDFADMQIDKHAVFPSVYRETIVNGEKESTMLDNYNMSEVYQYLKKFNINHPRLYDKYSTETNDASTSYTALDSSLNVQNFRIDYQADTVYRISLKYQVGSLISSSKKEIQFIPNKAVYVKSKNKSLWGQDEDMLITWNMKGTK